MNNKILCHEFEAVLFSNLMTIASESIDTSAKVIQAKERKYEMYGMI